MDAVEDGGKGFRPPWPLFFRASRRLNLFPLHKQIDLFGLKQNAFPRLIRRELALIDAPAQGRNAHLIYFARLLERNKLLLSHFRDPFLGRCASCRSRRSICKSLLHGPFRRPRNQTPARSHGTRYSIPLVTASHFSDSIAHGLNAFELIVQVAAVSVDGLADHL